MTAVYIRLKIAIHISKKFSFEQQQKTPEQLPRKAYEHHSQSFENPLIKRKFYKIRGRKNCFTFKGTAIKITIFFSPKTMKPKI